MTSKPDSVSTRGYHWTDRTGRLLEPQVHWDVSGTTLADASTQWCSSGDPVLICIIGTHWKTTGRPLEPQVHWDTTGKTLADAMTQWCPSGDPVLICIIGTHWKTTGKPLEDHWKTTGSTLATNNFSPVAFQCTLGSKFEAHRVATGLPLEDHWLRVRVWLFRQWYASIQHFRLTCAHWDSFWCSRHATSSCAAKKTPE